jgi:hypothetical protein
VDTPWSERRLRHVVIVSIAAVTALFLADVAVSGAHASAGADDRVAETTDAG